ncbi:MAG: undecaprenyl-diphosphatase UppP [Turneriella sp.]|nr:undecaprenyl-diphosphatase UppP [Turneriella sp.]
MTPLEAVLLGAIEGLTEFLPISSTGHMILADHLLAIKDREFVKTFEIAIQLGAIAAVFLLYVRRFLREKKLYGYLLLGFLPTGIAGFLFYRTIRQFLFNPVSVSLALVLGGVLLLFFDRLAQENEKDHKELTAKRAFTIGVFQILSMIPGVSRAAATIGGGLVCGLRRVLAVEFSFLLAVPTMVVATGYDLFKQRGMLHAVHTDLLLIGALVAFATAVLAVRFFVGFIARRGFWIFGVYRIVVGLVFFFVFWGKTLPGT